MGIPSMVTSQQPEQSSIVTELAKWPLEELGKEGRLITVEFPPGVHTPPHRHPGWQWIWVLDGRVVSQMEGEPLREYGPGEWWFEPRDHLHVDSGNDSGEASARLLVFYLTEPGQPVTVLEN
jgi:quercetin dioxygenase-like cupin family protein